MAFESGTVPGDAVIVLLYKGKGDKGRFNYRRICKLSLVSEVYDRILIDRVRKIKIGDV